MVHSGELSAMDEMAMRPKSPEAPTDDLFRSSLAAIIDPKHDLIVLAGLYLLHRERVRGHKEEAERKAKLSAGH